MKRIPTGPANAATTSSGTVAREICNSQIGEILERISEWRADIKDDITHLKVIVGALSHQISSLRESRAEPLRHRQFERSFNLPLKTMEEVATLEEAIQDPGTEELKVSFINFFRKFCVDFNLHFCLVRLPIGD